MISRELQNTSHCAICSGLSVKQSRCSFYFDGVLSLICYFICPHLLPAFLEAITNNAGNKNLEITLVNVQQSQLLGWILETSILLIYYWSQPDPADLFVKEDEGTFLLRRKLHFFLLSHFLSQNQSLFARISSNQSSIHPSIHLYFLPNFINNSLLVKYSFAK